MVVVWANLDYPACVWNENSVNTQPIRSFLSFIPVNRVFVFRVFCEDPNGGRTIGLFVARHLGVAMRDLRIFSEHVLKYVAFRFRRDGLRLRQDVKRRSRRVDLNHCLRERRVRCRGAREASILK